VAAAFDPASYTPNRAASGLNGAIMVHQIDFARFEKLLSASKLASLRPRARAIAAAKGGHAFPPKKAGPLDSGITDASWWRWLVLDACIAKYGSGGAVLEAVGCF